MTRRVVRRVALPLVGLWLALLVAASAVGGMLPRGPQLAYLGVCNGWENLMLADVTYGLSQPLTCDRASKSQVVWSPDGTRLAYFNNAQATFSLKVLDVDSGQVFAHWFEDRIYANIQQPMSWSADARRLSFVGLARSSSEQRLFVLDTTTEEITQQLTELETDVLYPTWSPTDPDKLLYRQADGLYLLDTSVDTPPQRVSEFYTYQWLGDGSWLGYRSTRYFLQITTPGGATRELAPLPGERLIGVTSSPGGDALALAVSTSLGNMLIRMDLATGVTAPLTQGTPYLGQPSWSPDGDWIAFVGTPFGNDDIYLHHLPSGQDSQLTDAPTRDWTPLWRPR